MKTLSKPRWFEVEFIVYYVIIAYATWSVLHETYRISDSNSNYAHLLSKGWLFGSRQIDLSDHQYKSFRDGIPALAGLFSVFALLRVTRLLQAIIFISVLHGVRALEPIILCVFYHFAVKQLSRKLAVPFSWIFAISVLFWLDKSGKMIAWPTWLWQGALPRWNVVFKISLLRMLSFGLDFHHEQKPSSECNSCLNEICGKCRASKRADNFSFLAMFTYVFYPPLYLSGPIMSFNDFWKQNQQSKRPSISSICIYGARLASSWLCLEVILHLFHVCAIKSAQAWSLSFSTQSYAGVAFLNLKIVWLKLLVIWRFARFFALLDGIDPPENMNRCMSNNYSALMFWRSWHRSFNQWIVRYLYVPLGGKRTSPYNLFPVFAFVALWHDVNWQLAVWGCLIPLFILPEVLARAASQKFAMKHRAFYNNLAAIGASLNIFMMLVANLVGFGVGIEGTKLMLHQLIGKGGLMFVTSTLLVFYAAANIMFEIREAEFRKYGRYLSY